MKTVILCGGRGTRLGEHGASVPKALIEIGGRPVLWHLLKLYAHHGVKDFILCLGHLGDEIRRYFNDSAPRSGDHKTSDSEQWLQFEGCRVLCVDTGLDTNTGGRIKRIESYIGNDECFFATYGDGLADIDFRALAEFHRGHRHTATLTAVRPQLNFGLLKLDGENEVIEFREKPTLTEWVNGGFFVFRRQIFDYLDADSVLEREPFEQLALERQLMAYPHDGFWKCMDTYKDNIEFNQLWAAGQAAWKVWPE